jgi:hypothetical protein
MNTLLLAASLLAMPRWSPSSNFKSGRGRQRTDTPVHSDDAVTEDSHTPRGPTPEI